MTDIRGIHYEISQPVWNSNDGYWYQRRRQVDENGNLVGIGDQLIKLPNPNSRDGQFVPNLDLAKFGNMAGDVGQIVRGFAKKDVRTAAKGAISFFDDAKNGIFEDYKSWPGTDRPWENGDIPAQSGGGSAPDRAPAQPMPSPRTEDVPTRRLVRLASVSPTASATNPNDIVSPANVAGDAAAPSISAPQDPQGPLSVNDAYLLYLKRLNASQAQ
jgi:hypothetical protein